MQHFLLLVVLREQLNSSLTQEAVDLSIASYILKRPSEASVMCAYNSDGLFLICIKNGLSVQNQLGQFNRINNLAILVNTHVTGSNLIDKDNFVIVVTELELDVPEVKTDGL